MDGYNDVASSEGPGVYIRFPFKVVTEVVSVQSTCLYESLPSSQFFLHNIDLFCLLLLPKICIIVFHYHQL